MGQDDNLNASLAHIVLCCVAGRGISRMDGKSFTHPGMHANFFIHGIIGFLHYQSGTFNSDFTSIYGVSLKASRYLALPCLMADLYSSKKELSVLHLVSGVVPFALAVSGKDNVPLGNLMLACNIISLCHYSIQNNREWGWFTAISGLIAYFAAPNAGAKMMYPLSLALMEYCAYRLFHIHNDPMGGAGGAGARGSDKISRMIGRGDEAGQGSEIKMPSIIAVAKSLSAAIALKLILPDYPRHITFGSICGLIIYRMSKYN